MGVHKMVEYPEKLLEYFNGYKEEIKANPIKVKDWVGKDADEVYREKEQPLTMEGFENYVADHDGPWSLEQYFSNRENRYEDFVAICLRIKRIIRQDQISGGMAGIFNASITQRLNNLVDKTELKTTIVGKDLEDEEYK